MLKRILTAIRHPVSQNVIGLYGMQIAQFIVPLVTLPYVARVLEPSAFGLVVFSQGFAFLLVVFIDWGFGFTGTRSAAENQTDPEGLSHIVQRVRGAQLLLAAVSVPLALAALTFIPKMTHHPEFLVLAWVAAVATALTPGWFFVGIEKPRLIALIQLGVRVLGAALTFVLVKGPGDAWIVMALFAASCLAGWVAADVLMYRRVKFRRPQLAGVRHGDPAREHDLHGDDRRDAVQLVQCGPVGSFPTERRRRAFWRRGTSRARGVDAAQSNRGSRDSAVDGTAGRGQA